MKTAMIEQVRKAAVIEPKAVAVKPAAKPKNPKRKAAMAEIKKRGNDRGWGK